MPSFSGIIGSGTAFSARNFACPEPPERTEYCLERVKPGMRQKKLREQALERSKHEGKTHHPADMNIVIDLDDGVVHNDELFADVPTKRK